MTGVLGALGPLAKAPPNPNDVVGGWVAFVVVLAMGAAVVFLYFSLKKQLGRVNFEEKSTEDSGSGPGPAAPDDGERPADRPNGTAS